MASRAVSPTFHPADTSAERPARPQKWGLGMKICGFPSNLFFPALLVAVHVRVQLYEGTRVRWYRTVLLAVNKSAGAKFAISRLAVRKWKLSTEVQ